MKTWLGSLGFMAALLTAAAAPTPLVLISLDGFRWDYCERHPDATPHLRRLAHEGVSARALVGVYPTNTFPNHYSIVTGLYPSNHGVINNQMFDPELGEFFHYNRPNAAGDGRWWGGEPIWVTAAKQGCASGCELWPGSSAEISGVRPKYWRPYDYSRPFEQRLNDVIGWFKRPADERPLFVAFYLEETNRVGHRHGPDSPELVTAAALLDARVGALVQRFHDEGIGANVVIVSDHGMANASVDRVVLLDDYIDFTRVQIDFEESVVGLRPLNSADLAATERAIERMPHVKAYRSENLPPHFHLDPKKPRVPPLWILPDEGWHVMRRAQFEAKRKEFVKGQHGYDPALPSMQGIFIAHGPAFRTGAVIEAVENIHIYNLLCAATGLKPASNDGDDRLVKAALRSSE